MQTNHKYLWTRKRFCSEQKQKKKEIMNQECFWFYNRTCIGFCIFGLLSTSFLVSFFHSLHCVVSFPFNRCGTGNHNYSSLSLHGFRVRNYLEKHIMFVGISLICLSNGSDTKNRKEEGRAHVDLLHHPLAWTVSVYVYTLRIYSYPVNVRKCANVIG